MGTDNPKYRVHQFEIGEKIDRLQLEHFLNHLDGEVIAVIPDIKKNSFFQIYGVTKRVDHLIVIEKMTF